MNPKIGKHPLCWLEDSGLGIDGLVGECDGALDLGAMGITQLPAVVDGNPGLIDDHQRADVPFEDEAHATVDSRT